MKTLKERYEAARAAAMLIIDGAEASGRKELLPSEEERLAPLINDLCDNRDMSSGPVLTAKCSRCGEVKPGPAPHSPMGRPSSPFLCNDCLRLAGRGRPRRAP
jgi:hypothetical protein